MRSLYSISSKLIYGVFILGIFFYVLSIGTFHTQNLFDDALFFSKMPLPFTNGVLYYLWIAGFSLLSLVFLRKRKDIPLVDMVFLALVLWSFLSVSWASNQALGLSVSSRLLGAYLLFVMTRKLFSEHPNFRSYLSLSLGILFIIFSIFFILENFNVFQSFMDTGSRASFHHIRSFIGGKNNSAIFLSFSLPLLLFNLANRPFRDVSIIASLLCIVGILLCGSRNAIVFIGLFFILILLLRFGFTAWKLMIGFPVLLFSFLFILINFEVGGLFRSGMTYYHQRMAKISLGLLKDDNILLGIGAGQWTIMKDKMQYYINANLVHPHSDFMSFLSELGLIGFLLFAAVIGLVIYQVSRGVNKENRILRWQNHVCFAFAISVLWYMSFEDLKLSLNYYSLIILNWGIIFSDKEINRFKSDNKILGLVSQLSVILMSGWLIYYAYNLNKERSKIDNYRTSLQSQEWTYALYDLRQFDKQYYNTIGSRPLSNMEAEAYGNLQLDSLELASYYETLESFPHNVEAHSRLCEIYFERGEMEKSFRHFKFVRRFQNHMRFTNAYLKKFEKIPEYADKAKKLKKYKWNTRKVNLLPF